MTRERLIKVYKLAKLQVISGEKMKLKSHEMRKLQGCDNREIDEEEAEWVEDVVEVALKSNMATLKCIDGVRDFIMYIDRATISPSGAIESITAEHGRVMVKAAKEGMLKVRYYYDDKEDEWVVEIS